MTTRSPKTNTRSSATGKVGQAAPKGSTKKPVPVENEVTADSAAPQEVWSNELLSEIVQGLSMLKASIDKIDNDNKKNVADMRELREQLSALNAAPSAAQPLEINANSNDLHSHNVTFDANLVSHEQQLNQNNNLPSTSMSAVQQSLGENINSQSTHNFPNHSTPHLPRDVGVDTLPASTTYRQNSIYVEDRGSQLYPLPSFTGKPEDWPLFMVSFNDTTLEFAYNNRQNLMRLQKALQGDARQVVSSLLLYPDNVPQVMEELRFNFGRPEILVRSQLHQLQQIPQIFENNADGVINLSNKVRNIVALFKAANCNDQLMNPMLLEQLLAKLPRSKQFEWAKHAATIQSYVTIEHFSSWISDLAKIMCFMPVAPTIRQGGSSANALGQVQSHPKRMLHTSHSKNCLCCKGDHLVHDCEKFKSGNINEKWVQVKQHRLCISCLRSGHQLQNCNIKKVCGINGCKRMHNKLLHECGSVPEADVQNNKVSRVFNLHSVDENHLFRILPVRLTGPMGCKTVYAMFDEGSSITLLEEQVASQLGLRGQVSPLSLQWYNDQIKTESSRRVNVEITGLQLYAATYVMKNVRTVKKLSLPQQTFVKEEFANLSSLPILNYHNALPVLLIGLDNCHLGLAAKYIDGDEHLPVATETKLGWVAYGPTGNNENKCVRVCHIRETQPMKKILSLMENYFAIENEGVSSHAILESDENIRARKILNETTTKLTKQYQTGLLWREDDGRMPSSFEMAKNRLIKIENKMNKNPGYAKKYCKEMQKYIDKGYAQPLKNDEIHAGQGKQWYLPHFGVENPNKPDKLRIVFDAAATVSNVSLNSFLMKGPEQAKPMMQILMKFREKAIGVAGDIQEMFSQVKIRPADQHAQRFLWRNGNAKEPIRHYVMKSMIFGATCSPCCAEHVKNVNAEEHLNSMPNGAHAVIHNMYVDDLVISFDNLKVAQEVVSEAIAINAEAGFNLRNIVSNAIQLEKLFNKTTEQQVSYELSHVKTSERVLGLFWNKVNDTFVFRPQFHKIRQEVLDDVRPPTKREMLSIVMAIFDPLGFLANITVTPKILLQQTWKLNVQWDAHLPQEIYFKWQSWWSEFKNVQKFSIPRCYTPLLSNAEDVQLHIFVDASVSAYAAVAYLRVRNNDEVQVSFVTAKSRVAPTKATTVPRLELQAALLGSRLKQSLLAGHTIKITSTFFWSDSKTVILWIRSTKRDYKQFVGNRVAEIISHSGVNDWRWLPTSLNAADEATRPGAKMNDQWFKGPEFLSKSESNWPKEDVLLMSLPSNEVKAELLLIKETSVLKVINYNEFSSFYKLQRHVAWILRFVLNARCASRRGRILFAAELENAKKYICRWVQQEVYADELKILSKCQKIPKCSDLYQLTPFLDCDGLIKVQGRIDNAYCLPSAFRRPIIMPNSHHVTNLIMRDYHEKMHHQNNDLTINEMRQQYWVPRIKALLKNVQRCCSTCVKESARPIMPLMGQLPEDRLTPYLRPFTYVGVDYCGPFNVAIGRRREKRWVSLFTCLNTRAIHLEIAADLSTDAFLLCFRNFVNRRGTPVRIRSDNGTNFIKAQKEITTSTRLFDAAETQNTMAKNNIEWVFNCPANPHAGGCWERLIKIVKRLLYNILKGEAPQLHTFNSVLIEIENIVNSRPLTDLPVNANNEEPLTPNHFLLGCLNSTQTPAMNESICMRKQWRIAQNLKDRLWKRWTLEYLPQLLVRSKWFEKVEPITEGKLVLVIDHTLPRSQWKIGRVIKVFKAKDGQVRSAEIQMPSGTLKRPAAKLAVLSFGESFTSPKDSRGVEC